MDKKDEIFIRKHDGPAYFNPVYHQIQEERIQRKLRKKRVHDTDTESVSEYKNSNLKEETDNE